MATHVAAMHHSPIIVRQFRMKRNNRQAVFLQRGERRHLFLFFSSRRRHTRSLCDWSSDVCSSDLADLKGKTLTEPSRTDPITLTARKLMEMHGLKDGDVEIKYISGSRPRVDCLKSGEIGRASCRERV